MARRYRVLRELGRSHRIAALQAVDLESNDEVVLKVLSEHVLSPAAGARLRLDVAALRERVPDVVPGEVGPVDDRGLLCVVRPFIPGETLKQRLAVGRLDVDETVALAVSLFSALERVHAVAVLHRNIKPANIVFPADRARPPLLVDFGITPPADSGVRLEDVFYLAPEQSGIIESVLDARADLYAVGAVLHEALTGRPPFTGRSIGEILRQHLTARPPPLRDSVPDVPVALERMIEKLLRKDPRDRYQTAAGARADFVELAGALAAGVAQPEIIVGQHDRRTALTEPAFVGRADELASLEGALGEARAGRGGLVMVAAESGLGKTWLLEELGKRAVSRGAWVLHGRGVDQTAQRPFQVLSGVAHELVAAVEIDTGWRERIRARLGPLGVVACEILPELRAIFDTGDTHSLGPEAHGETRGFTALAALVDALGSAEQPVVVLLDDAQWADDFTLHLLGEWQRRPPEAGGRHVLIVVAARSEEVPEGHPLQGIAPSLHLALGPFDSDDVRQEIASMAGELPREAVDTVLRHSEGNPFLVMALVQGLVETGALAGDPSGWRLDPAALGELHTSYRVTDILALRIARLEGACVKLLTVGALLGRTFGAGLAAALADIDLETAVGDLDRCRGSLLWADAEGTSFTFVHDRIREALLARLSPEERRRLHRRAAERIQRTEPDRVFELAYHFDSAAEHAQALPYALAAAERARERFALELAERHYRIAARGALDADRATRFRIAFGLAETLTLRGRYDEAAERFAQALELGGTPREAALIEERWAQLSLKRGDLRAACEHGEAALRRIGRWVPGSAATCTAAALWELTVQVLHTQMPALFVGRRPFDDPDAETFVLHLYHGMNGPYFFSRGAVWAAWAHLRHLNLAERAPPSAELGRAYAAHAVILSGFPRLFERGLRLTRAGAELCARLGDPAGEAEAWTFHAMMLHFTARFAESVEVGRKASALYDRIGDRWLANSGLDFAVTSLFRMGDLEGCVRLAQHILERARAIGDAHALAWALDAWSRATDGQVPRELVEAERARSREHVQTSVVVSLAEGVMLLGEGRPSDAEAVFAEAVRRVKKEIHFFHDLVAPVAVYLVTAIRQQVERTSPLDPGRRRKLMRRADRASRQALRLSRKFRNNLPHALREAAYLAALRGDPRRARNLIDQSIATAGQLGEQHEVAQSRLARAEIGTALDWAGAAGERERAEADLRRLRGATPVPVGPEASARPEVTLSLIDRYATVLEAGHTIATALSAEAVHSALRAAVLALLRAERCVVLAIRTPQGAGEPELVPVHGDAPLLLSDTLVRRALRERQPVVESEEIGVRSGAARSALCAPISMRGNRVACVYATHGEVSGLFDEEARRVARFLVTLAGAALENAEGFAHIQASSRTLETRVAERTAQLADANLELERHLRQLRETQGQLVQAGKLAAIGTLVAGLSHELNNPVQVILGNAQTLIEQLPQGDPGETPLRSIERNALRCRQLVRTLLDFSRVSPAERTLTQPRQVVANVVALVQAEARSRDIEFVVDLPDGELPAIRIAAQEIESALLNLLSNAFHATPAGGSVALAVRATRDDAGDGVEFSVRDTGSGIPASVVDQIFDPFFTTKPVGEGTGLGLSLTRKIVEAHQGTLVIDSAVGQGTRARIWLSAEAGEMMGDESA